MASFSIVNLKLKTWTNTVNYLIGDSFCSMALNWNQVGKVFSCLAAFGSHELRCL